MYFISIAITIPGRPAPEPNSVHVFSFLSIKSIICAQSTMCLFLKLVSLLGLIRLIFLFSSRIKLINSSKIGNVSRETLNLSKIS